MELQQLRYVLAVAETLNFTRAAAMCHIVQSAMSHQIKALEQEIGVSLFARTSRRVELTAGGAAFLPAARASVEAADRAAADAAATATGELQGTLTVGVIPTVTAFDLPAALARFHAVHPGVGIKLRGQGSDESMAGIAEGAMDVAILGLPATTAPRGVAYRVLAREPLVAVVGANHRLAGRQRVHLADLIDETFVDFPAGSGGRAQADLAFAAAGLRREVAFEAMDAGLTLDLVRHGLAITLLPRGSVPDDGRLRTVAVSDGPRRVVYLAWSNFNPSPATLGFLRLAGEDVAGGRTPASGQEAIE